MLYVVEMLTKFLQPCILMLTCRRQACRSLANNIACMRQAHVVLDEGLQEQGHARDHGRLVIAGQSCIELFFACAEPPHLHWIA